MKSIEEPKNLLDNPLEQFNKAQKWCKAYGFKCNDPCYPKLIHAFIAGYGIDRKPTHGFVDNEFVAGHNLERDH